MVKRRHSEDHSLQPPLKRVRGDEADRLSRLSDELLLRTFSFLSTETLVICQRVCRKFYDIAGDSQLWKAAYYHRFVRPRALRLPGVKDGTNSSHNPSLAAKRSKWLDEEHLLRRERGFDWKRQYRLRHNWSRGICVVNEIQVSEEAPEPPLLVRMHGGIIYTADVVGGLRAWTSKEGRELLATVDLENKSIAPSSPTSIAVDGGLHAHSGHRIVLGFENGRFDLFEFSRRAGFRKVYGHPASSNGALSAVAYHSPYLITMTDSQLLSLYSIPEVTGDESVHSFVEPPRLLQSLRSHSASTPLSLCIRRLGDKLVASVAYTVANYLGFSVGIQEMHLSLSGSLLTTRLATSADAEYLSISPSAHRYQRSDQEAASDPGIAFNYSLIRSRPTSLSYTHPYLLVSHPDNTLTLFVVKSTSTALTISAGSRLWGHTSSVSGAHVGGRGRAVSVSRRGNELRVWELEGGLLSSSKRRNASRELSVRVTPEKNRSESQELHHLTEAIMRRGRGLGLALEHRVDDTSITRGWIGFDEENVVFLREKDHGGQSLVVYDFT